MSIVQLTLDMVPLLAVLTLDPFLAVGDVAFRSVEVYLFAVITELIVVVSV